MSVSVSAEQEDDEDVRPEFYSPRVVGASTNPLVSHAPAGGRGAQHRSLAQRITIAKSETSHTDGNPYAIRSRPVYTLEQATSMVRELEENVNVRIVKQKDSAREMNAGRGKKLPRVLSARKEKPETTKNVGFAEVVDPRQQLIDSLPPIANNPGAQRAIYEKLQRGLIDTHQRLSNVKIESKQKQKHFRRLKTELNDLYKNMQGSAVRDATMVAKPKRGEMIRGAKNPRTLTLHTQVARIERKTLALKEERLSMERIRERIENDWIIAVARLKDRRALLSKHDQQDDVLSRDYLNRCKADKGDALYVLKQIRQQMEKERNERTLALEDMRLRVSLDLNLSQVEANISHSREMIKQESHGDLDKKGEAKLKANNVLVQMKGSKESTLAERSWKTRLEFMQKLEKLKETTGGILQGQDASIDPNAEWVDGQALSNRLIEKYNHLRASLEQTQNDLALRQATLQRREGELKALRADLDVLLEYGRTPQTNESEMMLSYDARQRKADASVRNSQRNHKRKSTLASSLRLMVQNVLLLTRVAGVTRENVYKLTDDNDGLLQALQLAEDHLVGIIHQLPEDLKYMDKGGCSGSLNLAVRAAVQGNNGRITFKTQEVFTTIDLMNAEVKAANLNPPPPEDNKTKRTGKDKNGRRLTRLKDREGSTPSNWSEEMSGDNDEIKMERCQTTKEDEERKGGAVEQAADRVAKNTRTKRSAQ